MSMQEKVKDWTYARYAQIRQLYNSGTSRRELEIRFGRQSVDDALSRSNKMMY